jgi:hypothetical protein
MTMNVPPQPIENLKYTITATRRKMGILTLAWENHIARVPIAVK